MLIAIALLWSVGLIGSGLWSLIEHSRMLSTRPKQNQIESFARVQDVPTGIFSYSGSAAWAAIRLKVDSAIQSERPEFQLRYLQPNNSSTNSNTAIRMLLDDRLSFVQSARPLYELEYTQAQKRGFRVKQVPIAIDGIAVAVNPGLEIPSLTLDQLRSIYSGKISNWKQLGGPDLKITAYSPPASDSGTAEFFGADILQSQAFGTNVKFIATTTLALRRLANDPGGIYYASAPEIVPQCSIKALPLSRKPGEAIAPYQEPLVNLAGCPARRNKVNTRAFQTGQYPITRYLYVVTKENGRLEEQAGIAYTNFLLTAQGQELIARAGFVRIR